MKNAQGVAAVDVATARAEAAELEASRLRDEIGLQDAEMRRLEEALRRQRNDVADLARASGDERQALLASQLLDASSKVRELKNVVFHKQPSYMTKGTELKLKGLSTTANFAAEPSYGNVFRAKAKGEVPEVPITAEDALGSTSSAQPVISYHSDDNLSVRLTAETTDALKEVSDHDEVVHSFDESTPMNII